MTQTIPRYLVTLDTPMGQAQLEVPSFLGPNTAKRRAHMTACAIGWGDLPEVKVVSVELIEPEDDDTIHIAAGPVS